MFGSVKGQERAARRKAARQRFAGDREAQGAAMARTEKANQGEMIAELRALRAAQEETNRLLGLLVAQGQPQGGWMPPPPPHPPQPAGPARHGR